MAYGVETLQTSGGALIHLEEHKSPTSVAGAVAHWGVRYGDMELRERILEGIPDAQLTGDTGFEAVYKNRDGITQDEAIEDELEVATILGERTIAANGWKPEDIAGIFIGSGVPIADKKGYEDYAEVMTARLGLNPDIYRHSTYAACNSGVKEYLNALSNPDLQGKNLLVFGMEGIGRLTPFDKEKADALSQQTFSNGAASIGLIPGVTVSLLHDSFAVFEDTEKALSAHMMYGELVNEEGELWQEHEKISTIKYPVPPDGMLIDMKGPATTRFFVKNGSKFFKDAYGGFVEKYPDIHPARGVFHHPSIGVHHMLTGRLENAGISFPIPWVVKDGNSSAATALIARVRTLEDIKEGETEFVAAYGAGGSASAGFILNSGREFSLSKAT